MRVAATAPSQPRPGISSRYSVIDTAEGQTVDGLVKRISDSAVVRYDRKPSQRKAFARLRIYDLATYLETIQEP